MKNGARGRREDPFFLAFGRKNLEALKFRAAKAVSLEN